MIKEMVIANLYYKVTKFKIGIDLSIEPHEIESK